MSKLDYVREIVRKRNPNDAKFLQAVDEVLLSLEVVADKYPEFIEKGVFERIVEPERQIIFRVPWVDDNGKVQVNRGFRVQFNSAIGPYKGGIRFRENVDISTMKFLAFEQTFKNALTTLPMGGGKGGSDFDPKGKSDGEIMRFCQSFMSELSKYIGADTDVPAGDMGVGAREIGYMFGQYKKLRNEFTGVLTGKGLNWGGSLARTEATGYGLCYFTQAMLKDKGTSFEGKRVIISGSGNVAIFAAEKAMQMGAKVVAMSDTSGYVLDEDGINLDLVKEIKLVKRARMSTYVDSVPTAKYFANEKVWNVPCDIALPCGGENDVHAEDAQKLVDNKCYALCEGANMPCTPEAIDILMKNGVLYAPGKASNAGGVATSGLEMSQNSLRLSWSFEEVDEKLKGIMENIYATCAATAKEFDLGDNFMAGANIAGFMKVARAMIEQGIV